MDGPLAFFVGGHGTPQEDLAFEEDLVSNRVASLPAVFVYRWRSPVLVLGYAQDQGALDLDSCSRLGVPVVRRLSGGTGVVHHRALALALALRADHAWAGDLRGLYDRFLRVLSRALDVPGSVRAAGAGPGEPRVPRSPICFEGHLAESLLLDGRKFVGCAQVRRRAAVMIHGTVLFGLDATLQAALYGVDAARIERAATAVPQLDRPDLPTRVASELAAALGLALAAPALRPPPGREALARYGDPHWTPVRLDGAVTRPGALPCHEP
ncbi:MAG: lipoate--protein ligase family protein [Candidatus Riflebacteria bacterium]|nr:lipoate--protein ligase family protein [Candidatus Riflebacteria bacterium]